ncbi:hypothetical protein [Nibricoccus aquaticus]|uniref:hypothetical protein n=1 Tax=Nibricoccus aquaticus TaxID=2576891 RepID=UPI0010FE0913|nr:hypothetical protein [Nibricoccus aquaticus]
MPNSVARLLASSVRSASVCFEPATLAHASASARSYATFSSSTAVVGAGGFVFATGSALAAGAA